MFAAPPVIKTEVFARVPDSLRELRNPREQSGVARDCFPEGPSFDRAGNLYVTNIPYGQVFRVSPEAIQLFRTAVDRYRRVDVDSFVVYLMRIDVHRLIRRAVSRQAAIEQRAAQRQSAYAQWGATSGHSLEQ